MTNINKLKLAIGSPAQSNQFSVIINPPSILQISLPEVERISILAKSVTTPDDTVGTITLNQAGRQISFRGDREIGTIEISFRYDVNMKAHDLLYAWSDLLVGHDTFTAARTHSDYTGSIIIQKLRLYDNRTPEAQPEVVRTCEVKEAFLNSISGISLDQDSTNEGIIVSTNWSYTTFKWY